MNLRWRFFLEKNKYHFYIKKRQRRFIAPQACGHFFQRRTDASAAQPQFTQSPEQEMSEIPEKIVHFGSRRSALVRSRCTYVAVWPAWIGLEGFGRQIGGMHAESGHVAQKRRTTFEPSPRNQC